MLLKDAEYSALETPSLASNNRALPSSVRRTLEDGSTQKAVDGGDAEGCLWRSPRGQDINAQWRTRGFKDGDEKIRAINQGWFGDPFSRVDDADLSTQVESLDPVVAVLTDKDVSVTAEFTDSFISRFDKERGKPLTQFSKAVFQLERYEFVFCGSDAALFVNGGTFKDQLIGRYTGGGKQRQDGSPQPRPKCTVELRLIVDSMTYQSGEGNPIFGSPKNVGKHPDIRELMGRLPVKESLLPARSVASTEPKPPVTSRKGSVKKKCEDLEFASDLSSQPFATQAVGMPHPSEGEDDEDDEDEDGDEDEGGVDEDDDSSLASQQLVSESEGDDSDGSIFATQAHQLPARKSSKPSLSSPDSSSNTPSQSGADRISVARGKAHKKAPDDEDDDKLDSARVSTGTSPARKAGHQSSLHPGWKGITEVPAEFATIPEDQEKLLDEPGCM